MKRASLVLAALVFAFVAAERAVVAADADKPQYYELRVYTTKSEDQQKQINDYWEKAAVPAYNRMGIKPIGVFTDIDDSATSKVYVLIPFDSIDKVAEVNGKLAADKEYQTAAADFMGVPKATPSYERFDSTLLVAFDKFKKLEVPPSTAEKKPWVFELRTYESHNEAKGISKVDMFNAGEVEIMKEVGLSPVFFAQAVVGTQLPKLVYMVSGEDRDVHKKHFAAFSSHPTWTKLKNDPQYKDNTSKTGGIFLKRMSASQI
jgi:hypothetical protein